MRVKKVILFFICLFIGFVSLSQSTTTDSIIHLLKEHPEKDTTHVNLLIDLSGAFNNPDSTSFYVEQAISLAQKIDFKTGLANAFIRKGILISRSGKYEESTHLYREAKKLFIASGNYGRTLVCHLNSGNNYADLGNYEKSLFEYRRALTIADSTHDLAKKSGILNNIGTLYYVQGNYPEANKIFIDAAKVLERLGNDEKLAVAYGNIGAIYFVQNDVDNSSKYMLKAYEIHKKLGNIKGMGNQHLNLGSLYLENEMNEKGITYLKSALSIFHEIEYQVGISECYNNLGAAYSKLSDFSKALTYYKRALHIAIEAKNIHGEANIYQNMSRLYLNQNNLNQAENYALKSNEISKESGFLRFIQGNYIVLSQIYEKRGNHKKALDYFKEHIEIRDSLFNEEKHKQVAELEAQYETDKKEKEIELLSKEKALDKLELEKNHANIQQKNTLVYALIGGVIMVTLLGFMIWKRYNEKKESNVLLEAQNLEIAKQNKEIKDSIRYAKRIQSAILPPPEVVSKYLEKSFILYLPKDIVSGDFYWMHILPDSSVLFAAVDCTGHGVPGAMMSVIGYNHLNQCVNEYQLSTPAEILDKLNILVTDTLHQHEHHHVQDGMDISLCRLNMTSRELQFAGAHNPLYVIRDGHMIEKNADRIAIGSANMGNTKTFTHHSIPLCLGDMVYLFSDGYIDQFGGEEGKRFMKKNFKQLLINISHLSPKEQKERLLSTFHEWKGEIEQLDDLCVIGVRV